MAPRIDAIARVLLHDGWAPVRARTLAAQVHYRRRLFGRGPTRVEAARLRDAYARRRAVVAELARMYRA